MIRYINIHTHHQNYDNEIKTIINIDNFDIKLSKNQKYSIGIHPWLINKKDIKRLKNELESLVLSNKNIVAIGETGLDKAIEADFKQQTKLLEYHLELAKKHKKPIIIHCVRAYADFLRILKANDLQFIFHNFNANYDIAKKIINFGGYLSFGQTLLKNEKLIDVLKKTEGENIFFENDNLNNNVKDLYKFSTDLLNIDLRVFKEKIYTNFTSLFETK